MTTYLDDAALPRSYYEASVATRPVFPTLEQDQSVDICIVGGGFAGLHTAWQLQQHGISSTVIDAHDIGWGASGRNGGHVIPEFACGMTPFESALGLPATQSLWALLQDSAQDIRALATRFNADYAVGHIEAALTPRHAQALNRHLTHLQQAYGAPLQALSAEALVAAIGSQAYCAGYLNPTGGHVNPLKLLLGLAQALVQAGGAIYTHTPLTQLQSDASGHTLITPRARIRAKTVVITSNVGIAQIQGDQAIRRLQRRLMPVGTWIIGTEVIPEPLRTSLIPSGAAVVDTRMILDYYRLSPEGRMIFGGGCSYLGASTPTGYVEELRRHMEIIFPALRETRIEYAWGGVIDISYSRAPILGCRGAPAAPLYHSLGFSGSGVVATAALARAIAATISGDNTAQGQKYRTDFQALQTLPHRAFPFGKWLRGPMTALAMAFYRWRDG